MGAGRVLQGRDLVAGGVWVKRWRVWEEGVLGRGSARGGLAGVGGGGIESEVV